MGIIKRQGFKFSLLTYIGAAIGVFSTLFIYTQYKDLYGLYQFLFTTASLLSPFVGLSAASLAVRYHPHNQEDSKAYKGLLTLLIILTLLGSLIFLGLAAILKDTFFALFVQSGDDPLFQKYVYWAVPMAVVVTLNGMLTNYTSNYGRIVVPEIAGRFWYKIGLPVLILLAVARWITIDQFVIGVMVMLVMTTCVLLGYMISLKAIDLKWPAFLKDAYRRKDMAVYGLFAILNALSGQLALRIDTLMITKMVDLTATGAYNILLFLINIMVIPSDSINRISGPIISRSLTLNDLPEVKRIYQRSSLILLTAGLAVFPLIVLNISDLITLLPKSEEFQGFFLIVVFLGLAKVFDMTTSVNGQIIGYSKYFRFNLYILIVLAILNIFFNWLFISSMGAAGAALATLVSLSLYNLIKLFYIKYRFNMQPFTPATLKVTALAGLAFGAAFILPSTGHSIADMAIRTIVFLGLFGGPVYALKLVPQANDLILQIWKRIRK